MKRELSFALESQSQLTESLGRTRSTKPNSNASQTNGSIDESPDEIRAPINQCNGINVYTRNKRLKSSIENGDSVVMEEPKVDSVTQPRRFTRSALKMGDGESEGEKLVIEDDVAVKADESVKELEMKVPDQIELTKKPTNVRELLETGLLEDYPVFYNGCGKKGFALRGVLKDTGILCYCSLCQGSKIVPPSAFEVHACKVYKRAAQYICLQNGRSLLEVMKACKKYSLGTLAENIQSIIGPLTTKESITCQNCKGAGHGGQICDSCTGSPKQANPKKATEDEARFRPKSPLLVFNSVASAKVCNSSRSSSKGNITRKSSEPDLAPLSPRRASVHVSSQENCQKESTKKESVSACNSSQNKSKGKLSKKAVSVLKSPQNKTKAKISKKTVLVPESPQSAPLQILSQNKSQQQMIPKKVSKSVPFRSTSETASSSRWKITKKDQKMHKLVFEKGGLPNGTEVAYFSRGKKLLEGYKTNAGIFCRCCSSDVSPSQFEAHAGWASRRKPYSYIYISNGVSLHEFALSLLLKRNKNSAKDNDDLCIICADGGNLLLCDGCPRAFHQECASLPAVPRGKWYCKYCLSMFQREKFVAHNANALAAGRVSGVDVMDQITERCIRIFKNAGEAESVACVLCRGYDFSKSGFGPRTVILCDQCEKEYHVGCLKKNKMADLKELPKGKWFCCLDCRRIYSALQNLLVAGAEKLPDSLLDVIRKKHNEKDSQSVTNNLDVSWRLLSAKSSRKDRLLLSEAVAIFHDRFDPILDSASGRDFIPSMVYGRNIRGRDFGGMYCAILTVNSTVVSAGLLRIFGSDIAELPLVATTKGNQGKGYFQLLFSCIEKLLAFLSVRSFVLPAAEEAEAIWTKKFGFQKIPAEQLKNYRKTCLQMLTFEGTTMLEKPVPRCRIIGATVDEVEEQDVAMVDAPVEEQEVAAAVEVSGENRAK